MKITILIFFSLISQAVGAKTPPDLRPGDVLLQPLNCWACSLIEAEENTIYSHIGVVLAVAPEVIVAEAYVRVRKVGLVEFQSKTQIGQRTKVLRFRHQNLSFYLQNSSPAFTKLFEDYFENAKYDSAFLWNNFDDSGREKFYCSEMVSKLFQYFTGINTPIKRMHFQKNRDHWLRYFRGNVPDNEWGNSPADFDRSELFYSVGEL